MAKELILVPKLKYERLLKQVDPVKEPLTQDTTTIEQTLKQSPEKQQQTVNDFEFADTTNLLQSGTGFVSKKKRSGNLQEYPIFDKRKKPFTGLNIDNVTTINNIFMYINFYLYKLLFNKI